jgi:phenylalanyl-tRNA synthetase beta subunit
MAADLLVKYADAKVVSVADEYDNRNLKEKHVVVELSFINNRLGSNYDVNTVKEVFDRLSFVSSL